MTTEITTVFAIAIFSNRRLSKGTRASHSMVAKTVCVIPLAMAAPRAPYFGINEKSSSRLRAAETNPHLIITFWRSQLDNIAWAGRQKAFGIPRHAATIRAGTAPEYLLPYVTHTRGAAMAASPKCTGKEINAR